MTTFMLLGRLLAGNENFCSCICAVKAEETQEPVAAGKQAGSGWQWLAGRLISQPLMILPSQLR